MKKINIFLIIMIVVLGIYLLINQLNPKDIVEDSSGNVVETENTESEEDKSIVGIRPIKDEPERISEEQLTADIKNKKYIESTFMALEYTKVNNEQLSATLQGFLDDNSKMKPEDVISLVEIHEKTFLNRYLKVFVMSPTSEYNSINQEMRRIFYQMKSGFDTIHKYNGSSSKLTIEGTEIVEVGASVQSTKKEEEIVYDPSALSNGILQLKSVEQHINKALEKLGEIDTEIETRWIENGLTESDILEIIDNSNGASVNIDLGEKDTIIE